jgi:hypothetical protein
MPISLEPEQIFQVVLDIDAAKPADVRPVFLCKSQSMRDHLKILQVLDKWLEKDVTPETLFDATCCEIKRVVTATKNMGSFNLASDDFKDLLTYDEARELLRKIGSNAHLKPDEKKSSE